jgi:hypothetical protein
MFKYIFHGIQNVSFYAIFSLIVFFFFFTIITIWMIKADKKQLQEMRNKPLEENKPGF